MKECCICYRSAHGKGITTAPCGFNRIKIHKTCLNQWYNYQFKIFVISFQLSNINWNMFKNRCPHCNKNVHLCEQNGQRKLMQYIKLIKTIIKHWIVNHQEGYWSKTTGFIEFQKGLTSEKTDLHNNKKMIINILSCLHKNIKPLHGIRLVYNKKTRFREFLCVKTEKNNDITEYKVSLCRIAHVDQNCKTFLNDGYEISCTKRKICKRRMNYIL